MSSPTRSTPPSLLLLPSSRRLVFSTPAVFSVLQPLMLSGQLASCLDQLRLPPAESPITVIGGHSGVTIVPLLSQSKYGKAIAGETYEKLVHRIQFGGDEVVKAKDGAGSATLSMAYAGAKFTNALLRGLNGEKGVVTPTFVKSDLYADKGVDFFASNVELGVCIIIHHWKYCPHVICLG